MRQEELNTYKINGYENLCNYTFKNIPERTYSGRRTDQLTLITSNLPMNHKRFIDRYEDRVSSRLNEMCNYFEIKGKDRRKL